MGNFLALASVTGTISYLLEEVNRDVSGIKITTKPLDAIDTQNPTNGLNIFLYLVTPNSSIDAVDTLVIDSKGKPTNNPVLSLDLHYIITATSSENDDLIAQKILASAMRILNNHPILPSELIRKALRNKEGLESSDLADQVETVRLTLNALSTEDVTKVWTRFPAANFRPSVGYTAQVVLLESKLLESEGVMGHVASAAVEQLRSPIIERIEPQILEYAQDANIVIIGNNLKGPDMSVVLNDTLEIPIKSENVSEKRIIFKLPAEVEPGTMKVAVSHHLSGAVSDKEIVGIRANLRSNTLPFVLAPRILTPRQAKIAQGKELRVEFEPPASKGKMIFVYLGDKVYPATPEKSSSSDGNSKIGAGKITVPNDIPQGQYLLRVAVDGAVSRLETDGNPRSPSFGKVVSPYVEIAK